MNRSTPGLPVHHQLPEFTQTHVHRVGDAIQPSYPLSSPSPAPNPSQHQGLFQWVNSLHEVAKVLECSGNWKTLRRQGKVSLFFLSPLCFSMYSAWVYRPKIQPQAQTLYFFGANSKCLKQSSSREGVKLSTLIQSIKARGLHSINIWLWSEKEY